MPEIFDIIDWIMRAAIGGLIIIAGLFIFFWVFKFLCTIHAEIVAEKMREELEDLLDNIQSPEK